MSPMHIRSLLSQREELAGCVTFPAGGHQGVIKMDNVSEVPLRRSSLFNCQLCHQTALDGQTGNLNDSLPVVGPLALGE